MDNLFAIYDAYRSQANIHIEVKNFIKKDGHSPNFKKSNGMVARINGTTRVHAHCWSHDRTAADNEYWNAQITSWNHKRQMCDNQSRTNKNNSITVLIRHNYVDASTLLQYDKNCYK